MLSVVQMCYYVSNLNKITCSSRYQDFDMLFIPELVTSAKTLMEIADYNQCNYVTLLPRYEAFLCYLNNAIVLFLKNDLMDNWLENLKNINTN